MDSKNLIMELANKMEWTPKEVTDMLSALGSAIGTKLMEGDSVCLESFGSFQSEKTMERVGVHSGDGKSYLIPPEIVPVFKLDEALRKRIRSLEDNG